MRPTTECLTSAFKRGPPVFDSALNRLTWFHILVQQVEYMSDDDLQTLKKALPHDLSLINEVHGGVIRRQPVHYATTSRALSWLWSCGADINARTVAGEVHPVYGDFEMITLEWHLHTPLTAAVERRRPFSLPAMALVRLLLTSCADPSLVSHVRKLDGTVVTGWSPLQIAVHRHSWELFFVLVQWFVAHSTLDHQLRQAHMSGVTAAWLVNQSKHRVVFHDIMGHARIGSTPDFTGMPRSKIRSLFGERWRHFGRGAHAGAELSWIVLDRSLVSISATRIAFELSGAVSGAGQT